MILKILYTDILFVKEMNLLKLHHRMPDQESVLSAIQPRILLSEIADDLMTVQMNNFGTSPTKLAEESLINRNKHPIGLTTCSA
jgi:hypothetical protein